MPRRPTISILLSDDCVKSIALAVWKQPHSMEYSLKKLLFGLELPIIATDLPLCQHVLFWGRCFTLPSDRDGSTVILIHLETAIEQTVFINGGFKNNNTQLVSIIKYI